MTQKQKTYLEEMLVDPFRKRLFLHSVSFICKNNKLEVSVGLKFVLPLYTLIKGNVISVYIRSINAALSSSQVY